MIQMEMATKKEKLQSLIKKGREKLQGFVKNNKPEMLYIAAGFFITLGVMMISVPAGFIALGCYIFIALMITLRG